MKTAKRPWRKLQDLFVYEDRIERKPRKVARPDGKPPCAQAKLQQWEVLRGSKFLWRGHSGEQSGIPAWVRWEKKFLLSEEFTVFAHQCPEREWPKAMPGYRDG